MSVRLTPQGGGYHQIVLCLYFFESQKRRPEVVRRPRYPVLCQDLFT